MTTSFDAKRLYLKGLRPSLAEVFWLWGGGEAFRALALQLYRIKTFHPEVGEHVRLNELELELDLVSPLRFWTSCSPK